MPAEQQVKKITVLAGKGGNGGSALAAARHLHNSGADISLVLSAPAQELTIASARQLDILQRIGLTADVTDSVTDSDIIIDGLIGYSLQGDVRGRSLALIESANSSDALMISCDIPSGLDPDTGTVKGTAIESDATVTVALPYHGLFTAKAREYTGRIFVADVSVPQSVWRQMHISVQDLFSLSSVVEVL
ncbi:MAG: Bifunctional NAD(P)H-hydrate repair enzyme Nnr [candidate division WS6 bacterium OLB20]|uniref:Bifunctional NAD(P)H-hydrate repair enzyme Nnr n=1 Tax=candidate division WS6 bacterium OLB20 TaxID=1617426 RepID=A0A136LYZ9_9BACT|nr:MAG: Bifunctional NAD(P)H-hydrate repair enzyme Nnr [candidate division WS6 bacterium OLB20]